MLRHPRYIRVLAVCGLLAASGPALAEDGASRISLGGPTFDVFNPSKALLGRHADEPTIGVYPRADGKPDDVLMVYNTRVLRTEFDDSTAPATTTWADVTNLVDDAVNQTTDPILHGNDYDIPDLPRRTWTSQLAQSTLLIAWTDDSGKTWDYSKGGGHPNGADNQSVAAGPYPEGSPIPHPLYPHAVYYCSQSLVNAFCSRSDDGGHTWGAAVPIFPVDALCGNHGHVRVGADGTVYVPMNNSCQGAEGVTISVDAGLTWHYIKVPGTRNGRWDSSIGIANDGKTLYYGYAEESRDFPMIVKGTLNKSDPDNPTIDWDPRGAVNVGTPAGLYNVVFNTVVAGDPERAAYAFHGTTTKGDSGSDMQMSKAVWHLYVAATYDGGETWQLRQIQPDDPTQKRAICDKGINCPASPPDRNLLDFMDMVIDSKGRIIVGYADGCVGPCVKDGGPATYSDRGVLARQSGGKPLLAKFDNDPAFAPKSGTVPANGATGDPACDEVAGGDACTATYAAVAKATATRHSGAAPFAVTVDASMSEDLGGQGVARWVFNFGDGTVEESTTGVVTHTYGQPGAYRTTVAAYNKAGLESYNVAKLTFLVGEQRTDTGAFDEKGGYSIFAGALGAVLLLPLAAFAGLRRRHFH